MANFLIIVVVLTNLRMLTTGHLYSHIRWLAIQGIALGTFALLARWNHLSLDILIVGCVAFILKGFVFPILLKRLIHSIGVNQEKTPLVGYISSTVIGLLILIISLWIGTKLPIPGTDISKLVMPATLFSILSGLFLIISRKNAIIQVIGFIVMENGAFMLGVGSLYYPPFLVEIGTLFDMFGAVIIWIALIRYIHRAFHHINTEQLKRLKG